RAFAYYEEKICDWMVESGQFEILIASSSKDIKLREIIKVNSDRNIRKEFTRNSTVGDIVADPVGVRIIKEMIRKQKKSNSLESFIRDDMDEEEISSTMKYLPLRTLVYFADGSFTEEHINNILEQLNK
ncbi:MAG TPA: hypothetical protein VKY40_03885, partial [Halanaerobiales bacterium]|nr:hypothetical protein [Halanaerobiales bacterium]